MRKLCTFLQSGIDFSKNPCITELCTPDCSSLLQKRAFSFLAPRDTGKTHWLKSKFPDALYLDLLETGLYIDLSARPERLEKMIPESFKEWVILNEVQKIPELLNEVHRLIEGKGYKFILTGSSARNLRRKGVNLLAGRALTCKFYPLTCAEAMNDYLDLGYQFFYWRTSTQLEVDFVLYGSKGFLAIEVKRSKTIGPNDLSGLKAFEADYPEAKLFFSTEAKEESILGIFKQYP